MTWFPLGEVDIGALMVMVDKAASRGGAAVSSTEAFSTATMGTVDVEDSDRS